MFLLLNPSAAVQVQHLWLSTLYSPTSNSLTYSSFTSFGFQAKFWSKICQFGPTRSIILNKDNPEKTHK